MVFGVFLWQCEPKHSKIFSCGDNFVTVFGYGDSGLIRSPEGRGAMATQKEQKNWLKLLRVYSIPLILGVVVSLVWGNLSPESYETVVHGNILGLFGAGGGEGHGISLHFLINDIFMAFFFAIAGIEIVHSLSPGGVLNPIKKAVTPLMATFGGVIGPVLVFTALNGMFGSPDYASGWGVCTATDIALSWLLAKIVFGEHHPAISFLLFLAVVDDGIGLAIIAIFYPNPEAHADYTWLLMVLGGVALAFLFKKLSVNHWWLYLFVCGPLAWYGMYRAGLHPAISLVFIIPFLPSNAKASGIPHEVGEMEFDVEDGWVKDESVSCLGRCEHALSPIVDFGLFFFGLTNVGVELGNASMLTVLIAVSLIIGKALGIFAFTAIARLFRCGLPDGMTMRDIVVLGMIAGMGLTVAIFVAGLAFTDPVLQASAKMGALASAAVFVLAPIAKAVFRINRVADTPESHAKEDVSKGA